MKALNLCGFSEIAFDTPAQACQEEIQVHRSWLRALEQPDVLPGETLRQLAKRTWDALLSSKGLGVDTDGGGGFDVFYPLFSPSQQHFQIPFDSTRFPDGPFCEGLRDAARPGWFEEHWKSPSDCTGDEIISIQDLQSLPPKPNVRSRHENRKTLHSDSLLFLN